MANLVESRGAKLVGFTPGKGYLFESSKAVRGDHFAGLALDFENHGTQVNSRIKNWVEQLKGEFN